MFVINLLLDWARRARGTSKSSKKMMSNLSENGYIHKFGFSGDIDFDHFWYLGSCMFMRGTFMPSSSVFIELILHAIYGPLYKHLLFHSVFWIISNFRGFFQAFRNAL